MRRLAGTGLAPHSAGGPLRRGSTGTGDLRGTDAGRHEVRVRPDMRRRCAPPHVRRGTRADATPNPIDAGPRRSRERQWAYPYFSVGTRTSRDSARTSASAPVLPAIAPVLVRQRPCPYFPRCAYRYFSVGTRTSRESARTSASAPVPPAIAPVLVLQRQCPTLTAKPPYFTERRRQPPVVSARVSARQRASPAARLRARQRASPAGRLRARQRASLSKRFSISGSDATRTSPTTCRLRAETLSMVSVPLTWCQGG